MTYLTYLNYVTGSSATISTCYVTPCIVLNHDEQPKISLKKLVRKVENMVNVSYIYIATNLNLNEQFPHLFTFHYISSAGGFQPLRFSVCRNFTNTCAGAFGFLLSTLTGSTPAYFFTSNSCDK